MQLEANPKSKGKGKDCKGKGKGKGKEAKNESSKKAKERRSEKVLRLQQVRPREGRVAASPHHSNDNNGRAVAVLTPRRGTHVNVHHSNASCEQRNVSETSCESSSDQAVRSSGAGSIASTDTTHVKTIAAIPSNETYLMMDTCAGASISPRGFGQSATDDSTVAPVQLSTATDDRVHGNAVKKSCFGLRDGRKFQVLYHEADVSFPIVSIGEASQQGNWSVFGPGCQAMLPGSSGDFFRSCVKDPNAAKLYKHRGVYWLPYSDGHRCARIPERQGWPVKHHQSLC